MIRELLLEFKNIWEEERFFAKKTIQENKIFNKNITNKEDKKSFALSNLDSYSIVCKKIPVVLKRILDTTNDKYNIVGSIGKGQVASIPWISILDNEITNSSQNGYYIVYLFDYKLNKLYLCLNLGWTQYSKTYRLAEARKRILENTYLLKKILTNSIEVNRIDLLTDNTLAKGYEYGNIINITYELNNLPDNKVLENDFLSFIDHYKRLKKRIGKESIFLDSTLDKEEYKNNINQINIEHYNEINESLKINTRKKIAYIWVKNYRNFDNLSLNLSSKYKFNFSNNNINIVNKTEILDGFFGNTISDVMAIIGQNSSGKTSLLELINKLISKHKYKIESDFLFITESNDKLECFYSFEKNILIDNKDLIIKEYSEYKQNEIRTLMFSNIEDSNYRFLERNKTGEVLSSTIEDHFINKDKKDFKNNMQLISTKFFPLLKINVPKKIAVLYNDKEFFKIIKSSRKNIFNSNIILLALKYELLKKHNEKITNLNSLIKEFNILKNEYIGNINLKEQVNFIETIEDDILNKIETDSINIKKRGEVSFSINYNRVFLIKLLDLVENSNNFSFKWIGISSGEKAYLNMFSYIYNELKNTKISNVILCIDEGDLFLHPEWQVEFFNKLITCIPHFYNYNIQIILTSHSPMILSDFPNDNVVILKNKDNEYIKFFVMDGTELNSKTFGGNIYALYRDAFFLGGKKTSDFAAKKINELINSAESKNTEKQELIPQINMIGSEVIKYKLFDIIEGSKND